MWRSNHPYSKSKKQLQCLSPVEKGNTGKFCQNCKNLFNPYTSTHVPSNLPFRDVSSFCATMLHPSDDVAFFNSAHDDLDTWVSLIMKGHVL